MNQFMATEGADDNELRMDAASADGNRMDDLRIDDSDDLMARLLATMGSETEEEAEMVEEI